VQKWDGGVMSAEPVSLPRASRTRDAILNAAKHAFLRDGYDASLDRIAEEAGVARRSIFYNFASKEHLLEEIIDAMTASSVPLLVPDPTKEMEAALLEFAESYVASVTASDSTMLYRMLLSGAPNLLGKMRLVLERNYSHLTQVLVDYFQTQITAGTIGRIEPAFAAERFLTSILGFARIRLMLDMSIDSRRQRAYVRDAVLGFIHGLGPDSKQT
jgi:AcrR family transcriptional regulator